MIGSSMADLRPLSIGQLLDRAFRLYRNNFPVFIGIIAITQIPVSILSIATSAFTVAGSSDILANPNSAPDFEQFSNFFGPAMAIGIILAIVSIIFSQIGTAALTIGIADNYLGKKISIMGAFRSVGRSWLTLLGALFLVGIVIFAAFIPLGFLAIVPCLGAIVAARQSLTRAWELAKLRFWWIIGYMLILSLMSALITTGPTFLVSALLTSTVGTDNLLLSNIIQQTVSFLIKIIYLPLQLTAITLMYFDLRIRFEGFDLMVLAAAADDPDIDVADIDPHPFLDG